jgi:hypothetical protein
MSEEPRDRYEEEALRLVRVLASMAMEKRVSVRSLEKVGWPELFARASGLALPRAPRAAARGDEEGRMVGLLLRLGVIDAETARRTLSSAEEP